MSRAYSLDLRERVVASMRGGLSSYEAAAHYQVRPVFSAALVQPCAGPRPSCGVARGRPAGLFTGGQA